MVITKQSTEKNHKFRIPQNVSKRVVQKNRKRDDIQHVKF